MKVKLNESLPYNKTILTLSVIAVLTSLLCVLVGDILLPLLVAILGAMLCFERGPKRVYTYSTFAFVIIANIVGHIFIGQFMMFWGVQAIILSLIAYRYLAYGRSKMECVFVTTLIYALFIVISFVVIAIVNSGDSSLSSVVQYYREIFESLKTVFVQNMSYVFEQTSLQSNLAVTPEYLSALYDSLISNIISFIFIAAFVCSGISLKLFTFITWKKCDDKDYVIKWRFTTPSLYAYFYIALIFVSMFTMANVSIFTVCVSNLYNIFMIVYAYIGFNFVHAFLSIKRKPIFAFILLLIITVLMLNLALELLAIIGAIGTIRRNKAIVK